MVGALKDIDNTLHRERFISGGMQGDWHPSIKDLPNGTFVVLDQPDKAWLVWGSVLLEWSPGGYQSYMKRPDGEANVLTPQSVVAVLDAGYKPELHPSAGAMVKAVTRQ